MSKLLSSIQIGRNVFKNRVIMAPMCMFYKKTENGILTEEHYDHYVARALGGVAGIVVEATSVNPNGKIMEFDLGLYTKEQRDAFKRLVDRVHSYDCKIGIQLGHAGRKADKNYEEVVAPSPIAFGVKKVPKELSEEEIQGLVQDFINSSKLAKEAGFDFVEIHGAHGYLISQFLSPLTNKRTDEYGGSVENRYRFLKEIITSVKNSVDIDIHLRISASECSDEGNTIEDIISILKMAREDGVVFNSISSGGVIQCPPKNVYPGYQALLSKDIKAAGINAGVAGLLADYGICEYLLQSDACDVIYQGRALLNNPNWLYGAIDYFNERVGFKYPIDSYSAIKF